MIRLLQFWLGLCLLRELPQRLPASLWLLGLSAICYMVGSALVTTAGYGAVLGVQLALLDTALLTGFVASLLYLTGRRERIVQTLSALAGAGTLLGLPALLLVLLEKNVGLQSLALLWLLLLVWNLLVTAHIMRHALSVSMLLGVGVAILYLVISTRVIVTVFPQLATG